MDERGRAVVGIGGSPGSRAALAYALREAALRGAAVDVVAAFLPPDHPGVEYWTPMYGHAAADRTPSARATSSRG